MMEMDELLEKLIDLFYSEDQISGQRIIVHLFGSYDDYSYIGETTEVGKFFSWICHEEKILDISPGWKEPGYDLASRYWKDNTYAFSKKAKREILLNKLFESEK